jgi:hypothetical protein
MLKPPTQPVPTLSHNEQLAILAQARHHLLQAASGLAALSVQANQEEDYDLSEILEPFVPTILRLLEEYPALGQLFASRFAVEETRH